MKLLFVGIFATLMALTYAQTQYDSKFDGVNIDEILKNDRVLNNYLKCLLDKGPCTREGRELKKTLPDALQSNCSKCTEQQKKGSAKAIMHLQTRKPADWKKLTDKYDPQGNYLKNQKLAAGKN